MDSTIWNNQRHSVTGSLLVWIGMFFFARSLLSAVGLNAIENIGYLPWALSSTCLYYYAASVAPFNALVVGRSLRCSDVPHLLAVVVASALFSASSWGLLVFIESSIDPFTTAHRWGIISNAEWQQIRPSTARTVCNLLTACIAIPIAEEIIFRGAVLQTLLERHSRARALLFSALIFSLFHINKNYVGALIDGLLYAYLRIRTGSLTIPIFAHGLHNTIMTIAAISVGYSATAEIGMLGHLSYWRLEMLCGAAGIAVLVLWGVLICRQDRGILHDPI